MTNIEKAVKTKETECFRFFPTRKFYTTIGIKQKHWGKLYRGEVSPTIAELTAISNYFDFNINDLIG